jgi:hypothetical protein
LPTLAPVPKSEDNNGDVNDNYDDYECDGDNTNDDTDDDDDGDDDNDADDDDDNNNDDDGEWLCSLGP